MKTFSRNVNLFSLLILLFLGNTSHANDNVPTSPYSAWMVQVPADPDRFDWLQVKKGELFAGDLISMFDERVEFDSDEVGVHKIKMKDVQQLRTKYIVSVRLVDGRVIHGRLILDGETFFFSHSPDIKYPKEMMLTISPSSESAQSQWDSEVSAGFNFKKGNTQSFDYTIGADIRRLSAAGRFLFSYRGIYEEVTEVASQTTVKTEDNHRTTASYDYFYSKKTYFRLPTFEFIVDEFKNLDFQTTLGFGLGYEFVDSSDIELNFQLGPSIQWTKYLNVEEGENDNVVSPVIAFGAELEYDVTNDIEYFLLYDGKIVNKESGRYIQRLETGFDIELIDDLDLEIYTIINNTTDPVANDLGQKPENTDVIVTIGLEYEF
jgi:putative salt-induced outer membrane protein YdiY